MGEFTLHGVDLFGDPIIEESRGPVADKFVFPPFTVLDARAGEWQDRKRAWVNIGIKSEIGRDDGFVYEGLNTGANTSIFDPVLTELVYRWFCPEGGQIVDPFAGGSVRGVVAGCLGMKYWGSDLRGEQIEANEQQANQIYHKEKPIWVVGDSLETLSYAPEADFLFSCPPYGDLERYSDDPRDLSSMEWHTFEAAYKRVILKSLIRLKNDRFACFVVGDFRDKRGYYRNFVGATVSAFQQCGAGFYNDAILVTSVGSACMRVTKQFESGRKMAKTHQNVLVFCKGDWKKATQNIGRTMDSQS